MKKTYIARVVVTAVLLLTAFSFTSAQATFSAFTRTKLYPWTDPFESYSATIAPGTPAGASGESGILASPMRFRMLLPNSFNASGPKYPLIVFFHGSGEVGNYSATPNVAPFQDNEKQLVHGGQTHMNAVRNTPVKFNGLLLYPQMRKASNGDNYWGNSNIEATMRIVEKLIADYNVDPDRIYVHGLSGGGEATWRAITLYPRVFAAAHPMSAAGASFFNGSWGDMTKYVHIPLRSSQGGLDTNPTPDQGNTLVTSIRGIGGSIRYSWYPTTGHGTWNNEYAKADFFPWFLDKKKYSIRVFGERTSFCPGDNFSVTLGLTPGFTTYEWAKDGVTFLSSGAAGSNERTITQTVLPSSGVGLYTARFQRADGTWTPWSDAININSSQGPSPTPTATASGSTTLPTLDGHPDVNLVGPMDKLFYDWRRNVATNVGSNSSILVSTAGSYTLMTKDNAGTGFLADGVTPTEFRATPPGCLSAPSTPICVTTSNGFGTPAPVANFFASSVSQTSVQVSWDDRASDETGFELYRSTSSGSGYVLVTILPASAASNPMTYTDNNLLANTTYYYRMRVVNCFGGSAYSNEVSVTTSLDVTPPSSPILSVGSTSRTVINISWTASTDNVAVYQYDIYQNNVLIGTVPAGTLTYAATGLVAFSTYNYYVKARDVAGNASAQSNQVTAAAVNTGLFYKYYHHDGTITSALQVEPNATFIKSGTIANFLLTPKTQNDNFAFVYEGFINIPTTGNYTFYLKSDDGSMLYINNVLNVNHDGVHGSTEKAGTVLNLTAGSYPIKVIFFEVGGGESLTVSWKGPSITKATIPDAVLRDTYTPPAALTAPSNLAASAISFSAINFSWRDNSTNETGFEVYRSTASNGTYTVIGVAPVGAGSGTTRTYNDTGLAPSTAYYYKVRAVNANSASNLVGTATATTQAAGVAPAIPTGLTAIASSATQVDLSWGNVTGETGYEIQKSSNSTTGFVSIATKGVDVLTHSDTQVSGHTTVWYRIRSLGNGTNHSTYSASVSATTPNRAPVIPNIPDQTIQANSGTPQVINVTVTDPDSDPITFSFLSGPLPTGVVATNDGYGRLALTCTNVAIGTYNITVQASDGIASVSDPFVLTVNTNQAPVIQDIAIDGGAATGTNTIPSLITQEGRTLKLAIKILDPNANAQLTIAPVTSFGAAAGFTTLVAPLYLTTGTAIRTHTLSFAPGLGKAGIYNMSITYQDNAGGINVQNFVLTVLPMDKAFTISVNMAADATKYEGAPWNNSGLPATTLSNMKDESGNIVPLVTFTSGGSPSPGISTMPNGANPIYTKKVRDSYFRKNANATVTFLNLNPSLQYKVTMYGGFPEASPNYTKYTVAGAGAAEVLPDLLTTNNVNTTRTNSNYISPSATGTISVTFGKGTINTGNAYINAIVLEALFTADPTPPVAPSDLSLVAPAYNTVNVAWHDNSTNETNFQIWRASSAAGPFTTLVGTVPTNQVTFVDNTVVGRTSYYYKVKAINAYGESETGVSLITTPNGAPTPVNPGTVIVTAGQILQKNISATDPEGDAITFAVLNLPPFATLVDNGNGTGFIRFQPTVADVGSYTLTLKATDALTATSQVDFTLLVPDTEYDEAVYVNFVSTSASNAGAPWNNVTQFNNANTLTNNLGATSFTGVTPANSSIQLNVSTGWTASTDNLGVNTGTNSGVYPDKVLQSYWATTSTSGINMTLTNLNNSKRYNIALLGSRNEFWFGNTEYVINGVVKTLNTSKNRSNVVRFTGIQPTSGVITITVRKIATPVDPAPANAGIVNRDATLNAMVVEVYTPGTTPRRPTNLVAKGISKSAIRLTWFDNSSDETGFEIYRSESQAGPFTLIQTTAPNLETYDDTGRPQNKAYIYRVRSVKASGNSVYTNDAIASTYDKIVQVNINSPAGSGDLQAPSPPWNNTADGNPMPGSLFSNLIDISGTATATDLEIIVFGNGGVLNGGYITGNNSGVYPDAVLQNYYYYLPNDPISEWRLKDMELTKDYDLTFFADEWNFTKVGAVMATQFMANGVSVDLFNGRNATQTVTVRGVSPEPDGTIPFQMRAHPDAGTTAGVFNSIVIGSYTPLEATFDTEAPSVPTGLVASELSFDRVRLSWNPSTDNVGIAGYEIFEGSTLVLTVSDTTGMVLNLQPVTNYIFSVRSFDIKGNRSGFSNSIQVTTLSDGSSVTVYHPLAVGDIHLTSTWKADVGGGSPGDFTTNNQHFVLDRNAILTQALTISGTNSKLVVDNNSQLTLDGVLTAPVEVTGNAQVFVNTGISPSFTTIAPTSTITFSGNPNSVPGASYGNLVLSGENSTKTFATGTYLINGNLSIQDDLAISGSSGNTTQLNIAGNLTISGTPTMPADNQLFAVNFNSGTNQTLNSQAAAVRLFQLRVTNNTQLAVFNNPGVTNDITLGTAAGGGLTIDPGSSLTLGKHGITIQGTGAVNRNNETGQLRVSQSIININSTGSQVSNLYFTTNADTVSQINLGTGASGQVNIRTRMLVSNKVEITNGRLNSAGNVVLVSAANGTARIAPIRNTGQIIGNIEFQRYVSPKGRVYRYISTPVFGTKVVNWQQTMEVIGPFTGSQNAAAANSLYYFDESAGLLDNGWVPYPVANNQELMLVGRGYSIFTFSTAGSKKLRISGPTQQGEYEYTDYISFNSGSDVDSDDGWNLLGNPYASPIQWNNAGWEMTGFTGSAYIRSNEVIGGVTQGGFKAWNGTVGDADFKGIIAQGQSFWVKSDGSDTPYIKLVEDAKYDTLKATMFRIEEPVNHMTIALSNGVVTDKTYIHFRENATDMVEAATDAVKRPNDYFDLYTVANGSKLAINSLSPEFCEKSVGVNLDKTAAGNYSLSFTNINSFNYAATIKVVDHFTGTVTPVEEGTQYNFSVTSDPASFGARFEVVVGKPALQNNVIMTAANASVCEGTNDAAIRLENSQAGVTYQVMRDGVLLKTLTGNGSEVIGSLDASTLSYGLNTFTISAAFPGCSQVALTTQTQISYNATYTAAASDKVICEDKAADLKAAGAPEGSTYTWYASATANETLETNTTGEFTTPVLFKNADYYVSVTSNGCEGVRKPVAVTVEHLTTPVILVQGDELVSSSQSGNQWIINNEPLSGETAATLKPRASGIYSVSVAEGACVKLSAPVDFVITGFENDPSEELLLHPNPVKDRIRLRMPASVAVETPVAITLYNAQGLIVEKYGKVNKEAGIEIMATELSSGFYTMFIEVNGKVVQRRFIKE